MRSLLFVPGDSERKLEKGLGSGADVLIIDLEDSVAAENKKAAREMARAFVQGLDRKAAPTIYIRVNDLGTGMTEADLDALMPAAPDGIMLPKSTGVDDIGSLGAKLRVREAEHGVADGATRIVPIVTETPFAVLNVAGYRNATERLAGITWGAEDLAAEIGAAANRDAAGNYTDVFRFARAVTILAASACEVAAIDTVFPNFRDEEAFRRDCLEGVRDGFVGRMAIHPAQVPVINELFTPSPEALAEAQGIVDAFAAAGNPGVVGIGGKMYDRPHLKRAERLLARAGSGRGSD